MSKKKPIKNADGLLKEFDTTDELPNQWQIDELNEIVKALVQDLVQIGIPLKSEILINLLNK